MHVSDYFYVSATCENKIMAELTDTGDLTEIATKDIRTCNDTNWLALINTEWTFLHTSWWLSGVITISSDKASVVEEDAVRPVLYLTSFAKITGGSGTSSNPYKLSI